jgi:hypothetical protein
MSIESDQTLRSCSNVASGVREAIAALDAGRVDVARMRLAELLEAMGSEPDH